MSQIQHRSIGRFEPSCNARNHPFTVKCGLLQLPGCGDTIGETWITMAKLFPDTPPSEKTPADQLDSWKEIATYLSRDVTTVQRWEKREGMPVHRHVHDKRGSVYALAPELDAWLQSRRQSLAEEQVENEKESEPASAKAEGKTE